MDFETHFSEPVRQSFTYNLCIGYGAGVELPDHVVRSTLLGGHSGKGLEESDTLYISDGIGNLKLVVDEKGYLYLPNIPSEPGPKGSVYSDNGYLRLSP